MVNNMILYILTLFSIIVIISYFYKVLINHLDYKKRQSYIDKHILYMTILEYYMEKAFDIIYKDRVLIYSIEGTKPSDDDIKNNSIDFTKLTLKLLGPNLIKEFIFLYGNEETFYFVMAEYFNTKSEQDEIKQESINSMMIEGGAEDETI
jgi:hypothetical protein